MALYHFHVTQIKRSRGQSAIACAAYSGIGITKLREISEGNDCDFVLWNGTKRLLKRKRLDAYLDREYSI